MKNNREYFYKVVTLGDPGVGKTALLRAICGESFSNHYASTVGMDLHHLTVPCEDVTAQLELWDVSGKAINSPHFDNVLRDADAFLFLFDTSNRQSFLNVMGWYGAVQKPLQVAEPILLMVGTKTDLPLGIGEEEQSLFLKKTGLRSVEVSAKTMTGVKELFDMLSSVLTGVDKTGILRSRNQDELLHIVDTLMDPKVGVPVGDMKRRFRTHKNCFIGEDMVTWLIERAFASSREDAFHVAQQIEGLGMIHSVVGETEFVDDYVFYRFKGREQVSSII